MLRASSLIALSLGLMALVPSAASANLVINGGFESGSFSSWTVTPAAIGSDFSVSSGSHSGTYAAAFGATQNVEDRIDQNLTTVAGSTYTLDYFLRSDTTFSTNTRFEAFFNGVSVPGSVVLNQPAFGYTEYTFVVTATGATSDLGFGGYSLSSFFRLDDVSVNFLASAAVPEPTTVVSALLGLAGLGVVTLRRRFRKA